MKRNLHLTIFAVLLFASVFASMVSAKENDPPPVDFFVAPNGSDNDPGTKEKPFATLTRARDAIRQLKRINPDRDFTVVLLGGVYRLNETVVFSLSDSASNGHTITYTAYPGETPVIGSGVPVTKWEKVTDDIPGLPEEARGKVWMAPLPQELESIKTLYDGPMMLPRAKGPLFSPTKVYAYKPCPGNLNVTRSEDRWMLRHIDFPSGAIRNWENLRDVEIGFFPTPYQINILPLECVDEKLHVAKLAIEASVPPFSYNTGYGQKTEGCMWVENALDFLDQPGEWVVDSHHRRIYLWPVNDSPGESIVAPRLVELIRVEGKTDKYGLVDTPVRNIVFRGLTFSHAERDTWDESCKGLGIQHDWELHDRPTAALRFRGAENCIVNECHFTSSSGTAIRLDLYCQNMAITHNLIDHVGGMGILLCGYGPGKKDVNRNNRIISNHIHHCGQINLASHAIMAWQSGNNDIAHNLIHDCPRQAVGISGVRAISFNPETDFMESTRTIRWWEIPDSIVKGDKWDRFVPYLHGRDNVVEDNEIYRVLEELGDGAAINVSGAGTGNLIRRNEVYDIRNQHAVAALRTDGWQRGTQFEQNIVHDVATLGVERKNDNDFNNNIFFNVGGGKKAYIAFASFPHDTPVRGTKFQRNIYYDSGEKPVFYLDGYDPTRTRPNPMQSCEADYNLFYVAGDSLFGDRFLKEMKNKGIEQHSISIDPMFVDAAAGDFRLQPGSQAFKLGFQQIDTSEIGLLPDMPERFKK